MTNSRGHEPQTVSPTEASRSAQQVAFVAGIGLGFLALLAAVASGTCAAVIALAAMSVMGFIVAGVLELTIRRFGAGALKSGLVGR